MKIQKGVEVPKSKQARLLKYELALKKARNGDSFLARTAMLKMDAMYRLANRLGIRITVRIISDKSYRVWRVSGCDESKNAATHN